MLEMISRNDPETPTVDPERDFHPDKNVGLPDD